MSWSLELFWKPQQAIFEFRTRYYFSTKQMMLFSWLFCFLFLGYGLVYCLLSLFAICCCFLAVIVWDLVHIYFYLVDKVSLFDYCLFFLWFVCLIVLSICSACHLVYCRLNCVSYFSVCSESVGIVSLHDIMKHENKC